MSYTGGVDTAAATDGHLGGRPDGGGPPRPHDSPHGRRSLGVDILPAAEQHGQPLHERGHARPEPRRRALAPAAGLRIPRMAAAGVPRVADLRQQVARADHPHARRTRLHLVLRPRRRDRPVSATVLSGFGLGYTTEPGGRGLRGRHGRHPRGARRSRSACRARPSRPRSNATTSCAPPAWTRTSARCPSASSRSRTRRSTAAPSARAAACSS